MTDPSVCPACDAAATARIDSWPMEAGFQAAACWRCGLIFTHPQPSAATLKGYYAKEGAWYAARSGKDAGAQTKTKRSAPAMMAALDEHFPATAPTPGSKVLDFGCGTGSWLNTFQDHGWQTFGIEPSRDAAFMRHTRLGSVPSDATFDLVIAYHVLEHLPRPLDTVRELVGALRPGGHLLLSVPRIDTVAVHGDLQYCLQPRNHIMTYTEACLRGLLAAAGVPVVTALHALDDAFSNGQPVRLRLLARKGAATRPTPDPIAALRVVIDALRQLRPTRERKIV